jgi:hypothetical protein
MSHSSTKDSDDYKMTFVTADLGFQRICRFWSGGHPPSCPWNNGTLPAFVRQLPDYGAAISARPSSKFHHAAIGEVS